jgi:hypothetical protein
LEIAHAWLQRRKSKIDFQGLKGEYHSVNRVVKSISILSLVLFFALGASCPIIASPVPEMGCSHHVPSGEEGCESPVSFCELRSISNAIQAAVRAGDFFKIAHSSIFGFAPQIASGGVFLAAHWGAGSQATKSAKVPVHLFLSVLTI